jgi:hypothetical protein
MYEATEECGDVSHNITDHETTTTAAAIPAVKNNIPPPVCDKETAEHAGKAILQAKASARSGERNEHASISDTEHEFNGVSAEDLGHLHRLIKSDEGAHITRIECGLYDQGIRQGGVTNDTDQAAATTATAREATRIDTHLQASSTEREDFYTTYGHLALPPADEVLPCCTGYEGHYSFPAGLLPTVPRNPDD